jgi:iron(III) transport system substrate-binding protein
MLKQLSALCLSLVVSLCAQERKVVVYVSLDEEYARVILSAFEKDTGIKVEPAFDTEDNKTVGMVGRIIAERESPVADVYWNNECAQTIRLKNMGLLQPYASPSAEGIAAKFKDPEQYWTGFAARARVLIYNTQLMAAADVPTTTDDLTHARWKGKIAHARPLTGTTLTNAGVHYANSGVEATEKHYRALIANDVRFERGNGQVARLVGDGVIPCGMTDTDDVSARQREGKPVAMQLLDQQGQGALLIPNSVAVLKGAPHLAEAKVLVDYLLSPTVEAQLAAGVSAQIPLHAGVAPPAGIPAGFRSMEVDFSAAAQAIEQHKLDLERMFGGAVPQASTEPAADDNLVLWVALGCLAVAALLLVRSMKQKQVA